MKAVKPSQLLASLRKWPRWRWGVVLAAVAMLLVLWFRRGGHNAGDSSTFTARRGDLNISVLEGGSIKAVESQEIKCEVTEDDLRTNKVLVELDSSNLQKLIVQQDIQYESTAASLTDGEQNYEIQLNQNLSDIKAAEQKVRFARMDFDKFLGDKLTQAIVDQLGLEKELAEERTNALARSAAVVAPRPQAAPPRPAPNAAPKDQGPKPEVPAAEAGGPSAAGVSSGGAPGFATNGSAATEPIPARPTVIIDFSKYARIEALGDGEAKQKLRKFEDDLQVARKEEGQAKAKLEGSRRLFEKGF